MPLFGPIVLSDLGQVFKGMREVPGRGWEVGGRSGQQIGSAFANTGHC